ncbi:MAG: DoxX family protein [Verrucomicrobia bacterium]|nr:DoxX family protein [Verrucomicrobiota bacterium]
MGSLEEQKVISGSRRTRWPDIFKLGCVLVRVTVGALFVLAGATKAYDPGAFAIEIQRYQLVPWVLAALISVYLPWLEMLSGALLLLKRFERGALLLTTLLLLIFSLALASAMFRGLSIDCGCFGKAFTATGTTIPLLRNLLLLVFMGILWIKSR